MEDLWQLTNPIIAFRNVSKVFEDSGTQVLKDINFELEEGKFYTLLGASGSPFGWKTYQWYSYQ